MYSKAILPATAITEVARQSARDDADANRDVSEHTQRLAGMVHKANANRGVRHLVTPWLPVEPYFVDVCYKNDADELTPMKMPLVLPHEFVHEMYNRGDDTFNNQFFFGQDGDVDTNLTRYWKHIAQVQPWMQSHPGWHDVQQHPHRCVPLRMHGDEICYNKRNAKMLVYNWCSVLSRGLPRRLCKVFMMGVRKAFLLSMDCLVLALSWSFACLLTGVMPSHDENGSPLEGVRAAKANMPIAGESKFLLTQIVGDWEWLSDSFWLQHCDYRNDAFCYLCRATKNVGPFCAWVYTSNPGRLATMVTHAEFMQDRDDNPHCLLPGFHVLSIRLDLMHIVCLGVYHWLCGSAIWTILLLGRWGDESTPWKRCRAKQLRIATTEFRDWTKRNYLRHSHQTFSLSGLCMSTLQSRPDMYGQAANLSVVARWLSEVTLEYSGRGNPQHDLLANTLWGFTHSIRLLQQWPLILSLRQCAQLEECRRSALVCYGTLSAESAEAGSNLWVSKPKWHMYDHCLRLAIQERINPTFWWCFSDETFIGLLGRLAKIAANGPGLELAVVNKWLLQRLLLDNGDDLDPHGD